MFSTIIQHLHISTTAGNTLAVATDIAVHIVVILLGISKSRYAIHIVGPACT